MREAGRLAEAADCYRRAVALDPGYGMVHCNLARALNDQGNFEAGLESARRAVELIATGLWNKNWQVEPRVTRSPPERTARLVSFPFTSIDLPDSRT